MRKNKTKKNSAVIAVNKRARFEYEFLEEYEAGLVLLGWEVKSLREGRVQFNESYVLLKNGEAFLFGCTITPLLSASSHVDTDPVRTRKLLLHKKELARLAGAVERKGMTVVPKRLYWKNGKAKVEIALAKGKSTHDKRHAQKERDWNRDKQRIMKEARR